MSVDVDVEYVEVLEINFDEFIELVVVCFNDFDNVKLFSEVVGDFV